MRVKVLGSAAGGGFPQWNCGCSNCTSLREGTLPGSSRTQTQVAFSIDSEAWFLLGASPDLRTQILATPELAPPRGSRRSPIAGVFLTSAEVDSVMGLLHLREFTPLCVYATPSVQKILKTENNIFRVLDRSTPPAQWLGMSTQRELGGHSPSFSYSAVPLGETYPDYVSDSLRSKLPAEESVVGIIIEHHEKRLFFAPSVSGQSQQWKKVAESSDVIFLDGTFWHDDELTRATGSEKSARAMGHIPLSGENGLLQQISGIGRGRRILIHINNTNPILDEKSSAYREVCELGWEVAHDGMEIVL